MSLRDEVLVRKIIAGDREAFGELVERYTGLVRGVIYHKVRRPDEVDDLVQDVFCKAYQELQNLRDFAKFGPWLGRIALNRAQAWLRQYKVQKEYHTVQKIQGDNPLFRPDSILENDELQGIVWDALDRLRPEYRQILLLFHFENCPQRDIARFLNISLPTVKWRLLRARKNLHGKLEDIIPRTAVGRERGRLQRQRVMAALPLALLARPAESSWRWVLLSHLWQNHRLAPWAFALSLGTIGGVYFGETDSESTDRTTGLNAQIHSSISQEGEWVAAAPTAEEPNRIFPPCARALVR
jgi:RNA polymerase sigma-70 factor, ECF subfamily